MRSWLLIAAFVVGTVLPSGCLASIPDVRSVVTVDATAVNDQPSASQSISSPAFSTNGDNELVLAFVTCASSSMGMTVDSVTGGALNWEFVARGNAQGGDAEIWRVFASSVLRSVAIVATFSQVAPSSSIVLTSFRGVDASGENGLFAVGLPATSNAVSGTPTVGLVAQRAGSLVLAVGNDPTNAASHTAGSNQTLLHQYLAPSNDTFWIQRVDEATSTAGARITINDTAPTSDAFNLVAVEILPTQL